MNVAKFVVAKEEQHWYFTLIAANGEMIFKSKPYVRASNARNGITVLQNLCRQDLRVITE